MHALSLEYDLKIILRLRSELSVVLRLGDTEGSFAVDCCYDFIYYFFALEMLFNIAWSSLAVWKTLLVSFVSD